MIESPPPPADGLAAAQRSFDEGRYEAARAAAAAIEAGEGDGGGVAALRLRCMAAYRLGELDEAAQSAQRAVARVRQRDAGADLLIDV
jgi:hypothetical protein